MDTLDKSHPRNAPASWTVTLLGPGVETPPTAYTVQPAQVRNLMKLPYFFIIGRFGDFLS